MYTSKKFRVRPFEEVKSDIQTLAAYHSSARKVFLADGNGFVLSAEKLIPVLDEINNRFGKLQRISSYAMPRDIMAKSEEDLVLLKEKGLKLLYIGIESGDDEVLAMVNKGETTESTVNGIQKAHAAGIDTSLMVLTGLGGRKFSRQHAENSAKVINAVQPKFLSTLTLSYPYGAEHFAKRVPGGFEQLTLKELFEEQKIFIGNINTENVIFRSNHVSNNINLDGILSRDKEQILKTIDYAIATTPAGVYPREHGMF
jgi:radical SAM superfamily enzyme YgiQ (UPF0313 family)